jgi:hypothetical protein
LTSEFGPTCLCQAPVIEFKGVEVATDRVARMNALTSADRGRLAGKKKPKETSIAGRIGRATMSSLEAAAKTQAAAEHDPVIGRS